MLDNKAIELWQETNKLLARIAAALAKGVDETRPLAELAPKGCPIPGHHPSCDCERRHNELHPSGTG